MIVIAGSVVSIFTFTHILLVFQKNEKHYFLEHGNALDESVDKRARN